MSKIYHRYDPVTGYYLGDSVPCDHPEAQPPRNSTDELDPPPAPKDGFIPKRNLNTHRWEYEVSHVGKIIYNSKTGAAEVMYQHGPLPEGWQLEQPDLRSMEQKIQDEIYQETESLRHNIQSLQWEIEGHKINGNKKRQDECEKVLAASYARYADVLEKWKKMEEK